ncbi:restriction endonuclease [Stieleria marina]
MHCGNHEIKEIVSKSLWSRYLQHLEAERYRPTMYVNVTHKVILLQVRKDFEEEWFSSAYDVCADLENLIRIRAMSWLTNDKTTYELPAGILRVVGRVEDGDVVEIDKRLFTRFIEDLTMDYHILKRMSPRDFERAIAAVYARTGQFDRVILTPASGDEGRDVILEASKWGDKRMIVEVKRYRRRCVSAETVNSLVGVLTGEEPGAKAALLTTSTFAPQLKRHRSIRKALENESLELLELIELVEGCIQSDYSSEPLHFGTRR